MSVAKARPKAEYTFYLEDTVTSLTDFQALYAAGKIPQQEYEKRMELHASWLQSEIPNERVWRNAELQLTDYMLIPDATYAGTALAGTSRLEEVLAYRDALRKYNLSTDTRPVRPYWLTI